MTAAQREAKAASSSTASSSMTPPLKSVLKKLPEEEDVVVEPSIAKVEASTMADPDSTEFEAKATRDPRKDPNSVHHQLTHTPKLSNCDSQNAAGPVSTVVGARWQTDRC